MYEILCNILETFLDLINIAVIKRYEIELRYTLTLVSVAVTI